MRVVWGLIVGIAVASACGGSGKGAAEPEQEAETLEVLLERAVNNAIQINEQQNCGFFHGQNNEAVKDMFYDEIEVAIDNERLTQKKAGMSCTADAGDCASLKQCVEDEEDME